MKSSVYYLQQISVTCLSKVAKMRELSSTDSHCILLSPHQLLETVTMESVQASFWLFRIIYYLELVGIHSVIY